MSCRGNHGSSAMTSYARAASGLSDSQNQNLFHRLLGEGRAGNVQPPSGEALAAWLQQIKEDVENTRLIGDTQRQRILNRLNNLGEYTPDGPTFYAWKHIRRKALEGRSAVDQTYQQLSQHQGLTDEQRAERVQGLEQQFDQGEVSRNWQPPADLLARIGEWQTYRMVNAAFYGTASLPQDRRTLFVLEALAIEAGVVRENTTRAANPPAQVAVSQVEALPTRCQGCGQFIGEGSHNCPASVVLATRSGGQGAVVRRTLGEMATTEGGLRTLQTLADPELRGGFDVVTNGHNYSDLARQLLAGRAEIEAERAALSAAEQVTATPAVVATTESTPPVEAELPSQLPPPDPSGVWSELYQEMPEDDPDDLNAPGSTYGFEEVTNSLSTSLGEVASFNRLNESWRTNGLASLTPDEADQLYDYQRRRLSFQIRRLNSQNVFAVAVSRADPDRIAPIYQELAVILTEYQKRRWQLNQMQRERAVAGYPIGGDPDENEEGKTANTALSNWLSSRPDTTQATGQGLVWNRPEPEPQFALPNYPRPTPQEAEPLYFRVRAGQGDGLRRSVGTSGLPIVVAETNTPIPPGAVVLNWGDYEWEGNGQHAVINSTEAVKVARDKLMSLERLAELAPASTTRADQAVARFGPVFAGKSRTGQSGSGKAILQNPPGGPADRPLGNLSATALTGYDYYQEYLPQRTEYRALVLGGEVIALYRRVPQGEEPGQLRPDNFEYQPLTQIGQRQLEASQSAMERVGLDFGGVDLVEDNTTGRLMVLEVNSAPGLGQESLERLYNAAHAQLHSPEED